MSKFLYRQLGRPWLKRVYGYYFALLFLLKAWRVKDSNERFHLYSSMVNARFPAGSALHCHFMGKSTSGRVHLYLRLLPYAYLKKRFGWNPAFRWHILFCKRYDAAIWEDITLHCGRLLELYIRWEHGARKFVGLRLWVEKPQALMSSMGHEYGRFEFYHELDVTIPKYPVSRWWWGSGWFRITSPTGFSHLYHHFGKLIRFRFRERPYLYIGTELSPEAKEHLYRDVYNGRHYLAKNDRLLDMITGRTRDFFSERYPATCIDCDARFDPYSPEPDCPDWVRCDVCRWKALDDSVVTAA